LFGIIVAFVVVTVLFFALSSVKVHHIASISIAASFWQVISLFARFDIDWPSLIGGSLTASSASNFNTDFLSPNCVFPGMNYITLWIIQMMVPVVFIACFTTLYFLALMRSLIAGSIGNLTKRCLRIKFIRPLEWEKNPKNKVMKLILTLSFTLKNLTIYIFNLVNWMLSEKSSKRELMKIFNAIINSMLSLLSFSFIYIVTTASEVFVCTKHPNGVLTLNSSPDIVCFQGEWWIMAPITIATYILFGGGSILYFTTILVKYKDWEKSKNFIERNKFILKRFRKKLFFWEAVDTFRKCILSLLYIFLDEMLVIVTGILLLFSGFLLQSHFLPFKRKFQ
jgi:hypothetical protein